MNEGKTLRRLLAGAAVAAVTFYVVGFALNEHLRQRRGPWVVTFRSTPSGEPELVINQAALGVSNLTIRIAGERYTNSPVSLRFDTPHRNLPFGRVKYDDLTYWPGVVTLDLFGHEVELLPRTLYINRHPQAWNAATQWVLTPEERPRDLGPPHPPPEAGGTR